MVSRWPSKALTSVKKRWWMTQKRPITAKLIAKAMMSPSWLEISCHSSLLDVTPCGTSIWSTSRVIAIAKTPSLKATMRENSISFSSRLRRGVRRRATP